MEAEATIINLWRARNHESMARSRAKKKKAKHVAERISEREAIAVAADLRRASACEGMVRYRAKKKKRSTQLRGGSGSWNGKICGHYSAIPNLAGGEQLLSLFCSIPQNLCNHLEKLK
jgi:hypothetical protein